MNQHADTVPGLLRCRDEFESTWGVLEHLCNEQSHQAWLQAFRPSTCLLPVDMFDGIKLIEFTSLIPLLGSSAHAPHCLAARLRFELSWRCLARLCRRVWISIMRAKSTFSGCQVTRPALVGGSPRPIPYQLSIAFCRCSSRCFKCLRFWSLLRPMARAASRRAGSIAPRARGAQPPELSDRSENPIPVGVAGNTLTVMYGCRSRSGGCGTYEHMQFPRLLYSSRRRRPRSLEIPRSAE